MDINATTLQNLDASRTYYLSNSGEIKRTGFVQWFKCVFNVGDGRAKAAALAAKVKEALLADGAVESDMALDNEIRDLDTTYSLSGATLMEIASRFRSSHPEAVGRADARRAAEAIAEEQVNDWVAKKNAHPDPVSVGYLKKLAVYAAAPVISNPAKYADDNAFGKAVRSRMNLLGTMIGEIAMFARQSKLGYPAEQTVKLPDGRTFDSWGPLLKLDEAHFRLILACMADRDGKIRLSDCCTALHRYPEADIKALKNKINAMPLADAARPGAVAAFADAFREMYNAHILSVGKTAGNVGRLPTRIDEGLDGLVDEMRGIYGEAAVRQDAKIFNFVTSSAFTERVTPLVNQANNDNRPVHPSRIVDALREDCRYGVAAKFVLEQARALAVVHNLGKVSVPLGFVILRLNPGFRDELLACKNPDEAKAVFGKHESVVRAMIKLENEVDAERKRLPDLAAAKLAEATGMTVEEIKDVTSFKRLNMKGEDIVCEIVGGSYPGCREPGFDVAAAFGATIDEFVKTRVGLIKEVNDAEGVSDEVKAKWRLYILKTDKPTFLHADKFAKILAVRGEQLSNRLMGILAPGITADERARRLCEFTGQLNAEFVNLYGEEEWEDLGGDGHLPVLTMVLDAIATTTPNFMDRVNAVRGELTGLSLQTLDKYSNLGFGQHTREIICHGIAPAEE